ncbi:MAG: GNAT family N-acetyltransferase [Clostridiales bacterium]|nr:GNAT family N-acetyltransferase [Clostridiales bacterium]
MTELKFLLAQMEDLDSVFSMFTDAIKEMNKNNIDQWDNIYPDKNILKEDISKGELYIGLYHGKIASAYVINQESDDQYANGHWKYPESTYYVIHRLCVNPLFQNRGIGKLTMFHIENEIRKKGIETIRLDAFTLNPYAVKLYEKLGYIKVGFANWRKGKFYLMEKKVLI